MLPLIDGDILLYEIGFSSQPPNEEGEQIPLHIDGVVELVDRKIDIICAEVMATDDPVIFITGKRDIWNNKRLNPKWKEPYQPNFRDAVAVTKPYKGTRVLDKPFHFFNILAYLCAKYDVYMTNGIEADDKMSIVQRKSIEEYDPYLPETIICSRDKDLRQVPGWHYSWECGKQAAIGPYFEDGKLGTINLTPDRKGIKGYGEKFFYSQMLTGDTVDNIPGLPKCGPVKTFDVLHPCDTVEECQAVVWALYQEKFGEGALEYWDEQWKLLRLLEKDDE